MKIDQHVFAQRLIASTLRDEPVVATATPQQVIGDLRAEAAGTDEHSRSGGAFVDDIVEAAVDGESGIPEAGRHAHVLRLRTGRSHHRRESVDHLPRSRRVDHPMARPAQDSVLTCCRARR